MSVEPDWDIPPQAIVEVLSEPTRELFEGNFEALTSLLRLALLSGIELTLPTALHLLLDMSQSVVSSQRQMIIFTDRRDPEARLQVSRHFEPALVPDIEANLLHRWAGHVGKPLVVQRQMNAEMDQYLERVEAHSACAVPLFLEHDWAGSIQLFRTSDDPFTPAHGRLLWLLSLLAENQMARINALQQLTRMAYTDYLTGLRARSYFEQALEQEVHRALRRSSSCGLMLLDLDNFKAVNDQFGHSAGDEVLRQFARVLAREMRDVDTVARFGGDEFAAILPDTDFPNVRFVANRVREAVHNHIFRLTNLREPGREVELRLSLSIGAALCPSDERTPDQLLRAADLALYQAKQRGKDRPFFWHELRKTG